MKAAAVGWISAAVCALSVATPAAAHQLIPGVGGLAAMVLHPLAATDHLLAIVALGLLSGTSSSTRFDALLLMLALGVLGGYPIAVIGTSPDFAALAPLLLAATSGALTALAIRPPFAALAGLAALTGLAIGGATQPEDPASRAVKVTGNGGAIGSDGL
jgi:urease accessory protein